MPKALRHLITLSLLGRAILDRLQVSIFNYYLRAMCGTTSVTRQAKSYFHARPGSTLHLDDDRGPLGQHASWREGDVGMRLGIGPKSLSLSATLNAARIVAGRHGIKGSRARHGNTLVNLLDQGMLVSAIRFEQGEVVAERVSRSKARYHKLCPSAFGLKVIGDVHANFSTVELAYDFNLGPDALGILESYNRSFYQVFLYKKKKQINDPHGLSGQLRKGERFAIYRKGDTGILRFEAAISGRWVKELVGTQRVPDDAVGVVRVLRQLEERYLPVWLAVERYRTARPLTIRQVVRNLPRVRDSAALDRVAVPLAEKGRVRSVRSNRAGIESLRRRGLLENLYCVTKVRGWRVAAPGTDAFWRAWGSVPVVAEAR